MSHGSHDKGNGGKDNKSSNHHDDKYDRSDLHEPVDWMTYTHEQLYNMVHTGVNLAGAQAAATNWQKIGEDIAGVRSNLLKAVEDSAVGWDSDSARLARDGLTEVTNWVDDTANYATKVSAAITTETNNVEAARTAMPPPPKAPEPPVPAETTVPRPVLRPRDRLAVAEQVDGFGTASLREPRLVAQPTPGEFAGFETIGSSPVDTLAANDASHRRAADVMAAFQRNSAAVDQTVPAQFTPPVNPINPTPTGPELGGSRTPTAPDGTAGGGAGAPVTAGTQGQNRGTTNTSSRYGGSGGRGGAGASGGFGGMARPFGSNSGNQGAGGGAGGGASAGGAAGVSEGSRGGAGAAAAAASQSTGGQTKAFQNPLAMGGAPMAGAPAAAGGRDDAREHKTASYLEEDDNVFGLDRKAAPPVIGQ